MGIIYKHNSDFIFGYILPDGITEVINLSSGDNDFPVVTLEKEKVRKFLSIKFFVKSNKRLTLEEIFIEYVLSGKYKGE